MKIVVMGGTGLIGAQAVGLLQKKGHEVVAASKGSGVNTVTGDGLAQALSGAEVVVDVTSSPSFEDTAVMEFFEKSTGNILAAEIVAGVKHHIALSVVGTRRLQDSGYFRAKMVQEKLIEGGKTPYTIVQATQFFEFLCGIADASMVGQTVHLSTAYMQPIAAADVAEAIAEVALSAPINGTIELAGPERERLSNLVGKCLKAKQDTREIVAEAGASYFGVPLKDDSLVPGANARLGTTLLDDWMNKLALTKGGSK
jgi:uncharacterized protein YbjT (DUF2867 family)